MAAVRIPEAAADVRSAKGRIRRGERLDLPSHDGVGDGGAEAGQAQQKHAQAQNVIP